MKKLHHKLKNGKEKIKRKFKKSTETVKAKLNHAPKDVISFAKKNPLKTLGLSVLAGVIISRLTRLFG